MYSLFLFALVPGQFVENKDFSKDFQRRAFEATVYSYHPGSRSTGTAVVVGKRNGMTFLLTAAHIVPRTRVAGREKEDADAVELYHYKADKPDRGSSGTNARVVARMIEPDLAIVAVEWKDAPEPVPVYPASRKELIALKPPLPVMTLGARDGPPVIRFDRVSATKRIHKPDGSSPRCWEADTPQELGRSGGPMIDKTGHVIGIASGKERAKGYYSHIDEIHRGLFDAGFDWLVPKPANSTEAQKNSG